MAELTVLKGADERDLTRLDEYQAIGGYGSLETARGMTREALIEQISDASLRGRGGARHFPMGQAEPRARAGQASRAAYEKSSQTPTSPSRARSRTARSCAASRTASSRAA